MAGAIKDFFKFNKPKDSKESYWTCPRCKTQNPLTSPFCLTCAEEEEHGEIQEEKVRLQADNNPLVATLIQALNMYLHAAQVPSREVADEARKRGIKINMPQELALAPVQQLDQIADRFASNNRIMATGSGAVMGLPGGLLMLATIPTDISAVTFYSLKAISGIAQSYGFETRSEEGRSIALLLFAGATGIETITVGGSQVFLSTLTKNVLAKPYRDLIVRVTIKELATKLGLGVAERGVSRLIPVLGSVVGGTANYMFLTTVTENAKQHYRNKLIEQNKQNQILKSVPIPTPAPTPPPPMKPAPAPVAAASEPTLEPDEDEFQPDEYWGGENPI